MNKLKSTLETQLLGLRDYASNTDNQQSNYLRHIDAIEVELQQPSSKIWRRVGVLSLNLERVARWLASVGAVQVIDGRNDGWKTIQQAFQFHCWNVRSRHAIVDSQKSWDSNATCSGGFDTSTEVHLFLESIATHNDEFSHGFGKHLLKYLSRSDGGDETMLFTEPLKPFSIKLYSTWIGEEITFRADVANPLGHYQCVFDAWDSPTDLKCAIEQMCKIHYRECHDRGEFPMFVFEPYNIFPVEIMAVYRVRRDLGLETPKVDHPLLNSPLFTPPEKPEEIADPLLDRVIAHIRKDFPNAGLAHPWL